MGVSPIDIALAFGGIMALIVALLFALVFAPEIAAVLRKVLGWRRGR